MQATLTDYELKLLREVGNVSNQFPLPAYKWEIIPFEILARAIRGHIRKYYSYNKTMTEKYLKIINKLEQLKKAKDEKI